MTETAEREIELVAGVIGGITQKKADTWTVAVTPDGSQYAKNLWTKDANLIESLSAKIGQEGAFVASASYWSRQDGQQVRSLWIMQEGTEGVTIEKPQNATVSPPPPAKGYTQEAAVKKIDQGLSKEEWRRKDSAADKRALIAIASSALQHTMPSDPTTEDLNRYLERVSHLALAWLGSVRAERDDPAGEDIPFSGGAADHG